MSDADEGGGALAGIVSAVPERWRDRAMGVVLRLVAGTQAGAAVYGKGRSALAEADARSEIQQAIARDIGRRVVDDRAFMADQERRLLGRELTRQVNLEEVARKAAEALSDDPEPAAGETEVDADWLNAFSRHAEDATSERMRGLWAAILAGEIRRPGSKSLRFLRFLSELDRSTAEAFQALRDRVVGTSIVTLGSIALPPAIEFERIRALSEAGLCVSRIGEVSYPGPTPRLVIPIEDRTLVLNDGSGSPWHPGVQLTSLGMSLARLVKPVDPDQPIRSLLGWIGRSFRSIDLVEADGGIVRIADQQAQYIDPRFATPRAKA